LNIISLIFDFRHRGKNEILRSSFGKIKEKTAKVALRVRFSTPVALFFAALAAGPLIIAPASLGRANVDAAILRPQ
jgi:lipopolysaccharide export LptBFGC system permease protein LptF